MFQQYLILVAALGVSIVTLIISTIQGSRNFARSASAEYVRQLEVRIKDCEDDRSEMHDELDAQRREVSRLAAREVLLMRQLIEKGVLE